LQIAVPVPALSRGFHNEPIGTHTSRTMMLREVSVLFAATNATTSYDDIRRLIVDDNITLKSTLSTRKETFRRLKELYGLRTDILLYRALRDLWDANAEEQPVLAILCALARDPLLRVTAPFVLVAEMAVEKGAQTILFPVACRRQLNDLSDDMAARITIIYYTEIRDALLKSLSD
jgi:hypothetical protein